MVEESKQRICTADTNGHRDLDKPKKMWNEYSPDEMEHTKGPNPLKLIMIEFSCL